MYEYNVKVLRVIDGDTIDVDIDLGFSTVLKKKRIRLYGIDTPESRTRDKEEKVRGFLSKNYLLLKCPIGEYITLKSHGVGKFGRILGELFEYNKYEDKKRGIISKNYLLTKCPIGKYIRLKSHGVGKFGRILGELFEYNETSSINDEMCNEAYAVPYHGQSKEEIKQLHLENRQKLISKGLL